MACHYCFQTLASNDPFSGLFQIKKESFYSQLTGNMHLNHTQNSDIARLLGVAIRGTCETLEDGVTRVFICETGTFLVFGLQDQNM